MASTSRPMVFGLVLAALCTTSGITLASSSPRACASMSGRFDVPGLWLGHFSGGNWARRDDGARFVAWANEYRCFTSPGACQAWRRDLRRVHHSFRGHGTCIALRGGGRVYRHALEGVSTHY